MNVILTNIPCSEAARDHFPLLFHPHGLPVCLVMAYSLMGPQEPRFLPSLNASPPALRIHLTSGTLVASPLWSTPHLFIHSNFIELQNAWLCAMCQIYNSEQDPNSALTSFTDNSKDNYKKDWERERERMNYNKMSYVLWEIQGAPESLNTDWNGILMEDFPEGVASKLRSGQPAGVS